MSTYQGPALRETQLSHLLTLSSQRSPQLSTLTRQFHRGNRPGKGDSIVDGIRPQAWVSGLKDFLLTPPGSLATTCQLTLGEGVTSCAWFLTFHTEQPLWFSLFFIKDSWKYEIRFFKNTKCNTSAFFFFLPLFVLLWFQFSGVSFSWFMVLPLCDSFYPGPTLMDFSLSFQIPKILQ